MQTLSGKEYPEEIRIGGNTKYVSYYHNNRRKAGIRDIWASFNLFIHSYDNNVCRLYGLLKQLIKKDKKATWVQWVHYSWLELKDFALEIIKAQAIVPHEGRIWLLQTAPDIIEVYSNEDLESSEVNYIDINGNMVINDLESKFNGVRLIEYEWNEEKQRFLKVEERTPKSMVESLNNMYSYVSAFL